MRRRWFPNATWTWPAHSPQQEFGTGYTVLMNVSAFIKVQCYSRQAKRCGVCYVVTQRMLDAPIVINHRHPFKAHL